MAIKYSNTFHFLADQNLPKLENIPSGNPAVESFGRELILASFRSFRVSRFVSLSKESNSLKEVFRDRYYARNFLRFSPIFGGENLAFFLKTNVTYMIHFFGKKQNVE
jgi:hypothetical protein